MGVIVTDEAVKSGDSGDIIFGIAGVGKFDMKVYSHVLSLTHCSKTQFVQPVSDLITR